MRILYVLPRYDRTAIANRIHTEVIQAWRAVGIEAEILSFAADHRHPSRSLEDGIVVHRWPSGGSFPRRIANRALAALFPYPYLAGAILGIRRFLAATTPFDLCHIETAFPLGWAAVLAGHRLPPLAITLPGADVMAEPEFDYGYARFRSARAILPYVFRRALVIRADSPMIRELAIRRGAPADRVKAIPYNIADSSFPPATQSLAAFRAQCRAMVVERHRLDPHRPIVISLNRLHPFKGIVYLVEALPFVAQTGLAPQVLIVGPNRSTPRFGDYGALLNRRAAELGVADQVILTGAIPHDEALVYLAAADVAVVPSVSESFSRVVIEACAVGTPPVVTRSTGASAYVAAAQAGMVVESRSGPAIAAAISALLQDAATWQSFSSRAAALAPQFTSTQIATDLANLYRAALRGEPGRESVMVNEL
ncbi:glycosyltransferase family 4 protein [uncultured Chloroflexus sp.]|uniref:glycosyltransferase family 4 protein n=1 Tax=uncultured Chloroflexus sp. TaxID=214040 RepID=UPI00261C0934|nr:glycosyltransferase family 4 protein [uncultured Chloroflexus sp.]